MNRDRKAVRPDFPLLIMMSGLVLFGIIMIGSADGWVYDPKHVVPDTLMLKQIAGFIIGSGAIIILWKIPYDLIKVSVVPLYVLCLLLLILVLKFGTGAEEGDEVRRWLPVFGNTSIQPSELMKVTLILLLAVYFERNERRLHRFSTLLIAAVLSLIPLILIYKEPDLSTTLVLCAVIFSCFFVAGVKRIYVLAVILLAALGVWLVMKDALSEAPRILNEYQVERILAWLHPEDYALTIAYQSIRSRMAIGAGGLFGKGLFHNAGLVPVATTDFIFGIIGEELGLIGSSIVIIWIFLLSGRILTFAAKIQDVFGKVICTGIAIMIAFQSLVHVGVTLAILPNTGIPLPFISYGLSSLITNMVGIGIVLRIEAENRRSTKRR